MRQHEIERLVAQYHGMIAEQKLGRKKLSELAGISVKQARRVLETIQLIVKRTQEEFPPSVESISSEAILSKKESSETKETVSGIETPYVYDVTQDVYYTFLKKRTLRVPGVIHRQMKADYSNWDGKPATINQMCRTFQVPRHYLTEYIKIHGWTHDSEPMSDEVLLAEPIDALVEDVLMQKKHQLAVAYERKQWEEVERDAEKWRNFERTLLQELQKSISKSPSPARIRLKPVDPFALVMAPQDFHWGGYAWKDETGEAYSRKEAEQRILSKTTEIVSLLPGRPEKIYLSVGGDWFHIDGDHATTTKGTPQEIEGSPSEIFITGCEMALHHVEVLRQVAPVELVFMGGNHDRANSLALMMYLQAWYRNTADVIVHRTSQLRTYLEYQQVLMGFTHGDKVKPKDLGVVMATEAREAWGRTTSHIWFTGHLHHEVVREVGGIVQYQLPSLAGTDRWHARQGYTAARAGLCGHLVNRKGVMMSLFAAVEEK